MEDFERMLSESSGEIIEISSSKPDSETPEWRENLPHNIPVMPLRGVVLFPGTVAPLTIERPASQKLLEELLPTGRLLGLVTQKDADIDVPGPPDLYRVGVLGNVLRMIRQSSEHLLVLIQIVERIQVTEFTDTLPYLKGTFQILENVFPPINDKWKAKENNLRESAYEFIEVTPHIPDEAQQAMNA
ncbi:MAG: LON peptidase substrate-binding domain-containing protein, partial [Verrucomicrobiota bacterium]